jgi:hypothetical protein
LACCYTGTASVGRHQSSRPCGRQQQQAQTAPQQQQAEAQAQKGLKEETQKGEVA